MAYHLGGRKKSGLITTLSRKDPWVSQCSAFTFQVSLRKSGASL